jgi:hypothetical protein
VSVPCIEERHCCTGHVRVQRELAFPSIARPLRRAN